MYIFWKSAFSVVLPFSTSVSIELVSRMFTGTQPCFWASPPKMRTSHLAEGSLPFADAPLKCNVHVKYKCFLFGLLNLYALFVLTYLYWRFLLLRLCHRVPMLWNPTTQHCNPDLPPKYHNSVKRFAQTKIKKLCIPRLLNKLSIITQYREFLVL